jgi:hypothetical protein
VEPTSSPAWPSICATPKEVSGARELLARPPAEFLPQVLVPVRPFSDTGLSGAASTAMAALNADISGARLHPATMSPWAAGRGTGGALERLFVFDVPNHPSTTSSHSTGTGWPGVCAVSHTPADDRPISRRLTCRRFGHPQEPFWATGRNLFLRKGPRLS